MKNSNLKLSDVVQSIVSGDMDDFEEAVRLFRNGFPSHLANYFGVVDEVNGMLRNDRQHWDITDRDEDVKRIEDFLEGLKKKGF